MTDGIYVSLFCPLFMRLLLYLSQKLADVCLITLFSDRLRSYETSDGYRAEAMIAP